MSGETPYMLTAALLLGHGHAFLDMQCMGKQWVAPNGWLELWNPLEVTCCALVLLVKLIVDSYNSRMNLKDCGAHEWGISNWRKTEQRSLVF